MRRFISPGHNFFGHYGQPPGEHDTVEVQEIECVAGRGVKGDRFFDFKDDYKGQITFLSSEIFDEVCDWLGVPGESTGAARRNVVTRGVDLNALIGQQFEVQGVRFEGVCECSPCHWMNMAIAPGAEAALRGHGGVARKNFDGRNIAGGQMNFDAVILAGGKSLRMNRDKAV